MKLSILVCDGTTQGAACPATTEPVHASVPTPLPEGWTSTNAGEKHFCPEHRQQTEPPADDAYGLACPKCGGLDTELAIRPDSYRCLDCQHTFREADSTGLWLR